MLPDAAAGGGVESTERLSKAGFSGATWALSVLFLD